MLWRAARPRCAKEIGIKKEEQRAHKVGRQGRRERQREKKTERDECGGKGGGERERERQREGRAVNGLDIVSVESSSIKSNYDVIDRGPVGRGRGDAEGEAKSSE